MRKPRIKINIFKIESDGKYGFNLEREGKILHDGMRDYMNEEAAECDAEAKKIELQEAMMATGTAGSPASPPVANFKVRKPRKVKAKKDDGIGKYPEACGHLYDAVDAIQSITIGEAGENFERLNKAMETIENVRKDLSEIE